MSPRTQIKGEKMKKFLIEKLREGSYTYEELKKEAEKVFPRVASDTVRKSLERNLSELEDYGLVVKEVEKGEKRYYWYIYPNLYANEDREEKLRHSRKLIPFIKMMFDIELNEEDKRIFDSTPAELEKLYEAAAKTHLRVHLRSEGEEVRNLLAKYKELMDKIESKREELKRRIEDKLKDRFGESETDKAKLFFYHSGLDEIYDIIYCARAPGSKWMHSGKDFRISSGTLWLNSLLIAEEQPDPEDRSKCIPLRGGSLSELREFIEEQIMDKSNTDLVEEIIKDEESLSECKKELRKEIYIIIDGVDNGVPLKGRCSLCPKIIRETASKQGEQTKMQLKS
ncbi:hypothetical protein D6D85_05075 [Candidatus Methanodesulfokora washburnensis]|uniref:Uncharacterized protein n=2 Tax=Candidatus Methanodesulfokora washburnensis TaxID=2478471 RepID=A0A3R9PXX3_9CREN|nr:hypothetical protein D6D85_05075 [Candidatus Methanodesulfokores washburnensis]